ncbi:MAG: M23 family metallopeptidase [Candidatus Krumholzibacteria bacterium]|nr:M23 family metallopeptidase [Candidatus Krumholzibacteria bacterium]
MTRYTRNILINEEEQGVREFTISHRMVWLLGVLGVLLAGLILWVLLTYGNLFRRAATVPRLEQEVAAARAELRILDQLQGELATVGSLQEQLLLILGVEPAAGDSLGGLVEPAGDDLQALAALVLTPPPDTWPAAGFVSSEFTEGDTPRGLRPHLGLDIAGPQGAPILAAGDGIVARVAEDPFLGIFVEIQHGLGYLTVYGHCANAAVARGEQVRRGQVVAYMGASGQASAPHLHFEIWHNGMAVDPRQFLSGEPPLP